MKKSCTFLILIAFQAGVTFAGGLKLTSPNGGEEICLGRLFRITWDAAGVRQRVKLVLIRGGARLGVIASNLDATAQAYDWTLAGRHANGTAPVGSDYKIRLITMEEDKWDLSDQAFALKECAGGPVHRVDDLKVIPPALQATRPDLSPRKLQKKPRLRITEFLYSYGWSQDQFIARVKNVGDEPFLGTIRCTWMTPCGGHLETRSYVTLEEARFLEGERGWPFFLPCAMPRGFCSVHASCTIEAIGPDGTNYGRDSAENDFFCYFNSQFLLESQRIMFIFLHGSRWVNCGSQCVITAADAYDYDPETRMATFTLGFPIKNCGSEAGKSNNYTEDSLNWSIFHTPSNTNAAAGSVCPDRCSSSPVEPGQGILIERSVSLKIQEGIYMLNVYSGSIQDGVHHCAISIRFADSLIQ